jgi:ribonuclease HIII
MGVFSKILSKIFGSAKANAGPAAQQSQFSPKSSTTSTTAQQGGAQTQQPVDVNAILTDMAARNQQKLNWQTSIVDLMKLLGLDSSLSERQELARELGYTGDMSDSATMNIWLHKQVMTKLAENGGRVPQELLN